MWAADGAGFFMPEPLGFPYCSLEPPLLANARRHRPNLITHAAELQTQSTHAQWVGREPLASFVEGSKSSNSPP